MSLRRTALFVALSAALPACKPYNNRSGDYYAGPLDPAMFAPAYQGAGGDGSAPQMSSGKGFVHNQMQGTFTPSDAFTEGQQVGYFWFASSQGELTLNSAATGDRAPVYVFDGGEAQDSNKCKAPANYVFDQRTDFVRFDVQANVFEEQQEASAPAALPSDAGYVPVYAEVPVTSMNEDCQSVKSAEGLVGDNTKSLSVSLAPLAVMNSTLHQVGVPDGKYIAMAIIDPSADVLLTSEDPRCIAQGGGGPCHDPATGLGAQRWGFFNHYLAAYIEGGYIPTMQVTVPGMNGMPDQMATQAQAMTLYAPNMLSNGLTGAMPTGDPANPLGDAMTGPIFGHGADLIVGFDGKSGKRGDAGYSPFCHVLSYTPADPTMPWTKASQVDMTALDPDTGTFIYCMQVAQ